MIIGLVGFKGAGKDTVANIILEERVNFFVRKEFAGPLKDVVASVFNWDRKLLQGDTLVSREWREVPDSWWSEHLGIPNFSPRLALQLIGTDVFRNHFHNDIWLLSLQRKLIDQDKHIIVTDCRFPNEIKLIQDLSGIVVRVKRGPDPKWWDVAVKANKQKDTSVMKSKYPKVHESEYSWVGSKIDYTIDNSGTLDDLRFNVKQFLTSVV